MQVDMAVTSGFARSKIVPGLDARFSIEDLRDLFHFRFRELVVHQVTAGVASQLPPDLADQNRHAESDYRVDDMPAGDPDKDQTNSDTQRCEYISREMMRVGLKRDGIFGLCYLEEVPRYKEVHHDRESHDQRAKADMLDLAAGDDLPHRFNRDPDRGENDQSGLYGAGDRFGFSVTKGMFLIRRLVGDTN